MAEPLKQRGHTVKCSDLLDRGYQGTEIIDFLNTQERFNGDIITNPPYKYAEAFVEKSLSLIEPGNKVAMFMGIQFIEGKKRREFLKRNKIKYVYVSSSRLNCAKNGDFVKYKGNSARCYAWYIWEKGFEGDTILRTFN